ncbi:MAG: hydrogenase formation protein HypD [Chloroflexi bacterium]|nr:hydrogenase formation protein HypD [Chloroflexota bacterium]
MKYVDEFRDPQLAGGLLERIAQRSTRAVRLMEFCGGHTHAILQHGLRQLLPPTVTLRSGPGCPVCVTSAHDLDVAIALAGVPGAILATFGDMVRVPGSRESLHDARARGADVRVVYSPLDALTLAEAHPGRPVIFLAVGFETTAPTVAATLLRAEERGVGNLYVQSLHKLTLPAVRAILADGEVRLDGVIGPGHVATVTGSRAWRLLPDEYRVPCAIAGFEPVDLLAAILALVEMAEDGRPDLANTYGRSVRPEGNPRAQEVMLRAFHEVDAEWRGLGTLPGSGLGLREALAHRDAARVFRVDVPPPAPPRGCRCGDIVRGALEPGDCPLFRVACTPARPAGPCMVSAEGACAAYFRYGGDE